MFVLFGKERRKNNKLKNKEKNPVSIKKDNRPGASQFPENNPTGGMEISLYAKHHNTHEGEVWRKIRSGELIAKPYKNKLYIYSETNNGILLDSKEPLFTIDKSSTPSAPIIDEDLLQEESLPELPEFKESLTGASKSLINTNTSSSESQQIALLLDHLSLAKEENREVLQLAKETVEKVTKMSEEIVSMKDSIIESHKEHIEIEKKKVEDLSQQMEQQKLELSAEIEKQKNELNEQLKQQEDDLRKLRQENEDLNMLNKMIESSTT